MLRLPILPTSVSNSFPVRGKPLKQKPDPFIDLLHPHKLPRTVRHNSLRTWQFIKHDSQWVYTLMSSLKEWENASSPLGNLPPASLLGSITRLHLFFKYTFINFMCRFHSAQGVISNLSTNNSSRVSFPWLRLKLFKYVCVTLLWSTLSQWRMSAVALLLMGWDERGRQRGWLSLPCLTLPERPYQRLEICCCDGDIISCLTPACQD